MALSVVAITVAWMNSHPECGGAAWLMSRVATEADYEKAGLSQLVIKTKAATNNTTAEHNRNSGLWDSTKVFVGAQISKATDSSNTGVREAAVGARP